MLGAIIKFLFYQPTFNLLIFFYNLFGGNLGIAILVIAAFAKLITIPITQKQLKSAEKMKVFQQKSNEVRKKYAKNKDKMNDELMKLSSKYMPAQLGGCLPMIITIILLIQVRGVVINLVNQGYHAYNEVAYIESQKIPEDQVKFDIEDLEEGEHTLNFKVIATNGNELDKDISFFIVDSEEEGEEKIKEERKALKDISDEEKDANESILKTERESEISVYVSNFKDGNFVVDDDFTFEAYLRAPSNEKIASVQVYLDDTEYTDDAAITQGEPLNFEFWGMNLSRVGRDFYGDWQTFTPYVILAIFLGISQFVITKIQMGTKEPDKKQVKSDRKKPTKKKTKEPENVDFGEAMQQSSRQMAVMMPAMTMAISLGYLGGSSLFPSGVSVFWTAQNAFVIIQLAITKREKLKKMVIEKITELKSRRVQS